MVTCTVMLSINLIYPFGAVISLIVIVSGVEISAISTIPKFKIPFTVVPVCSLCPGNVHPNSVSEDVIIFPFSSTFSNCN